MRKNVVLRAAFASLVLLAGGPTQAQAQFDKYVALGDSITASFQGLCLVTRHQQASYPKLISEQLGITDFQQPLFAEGALTGNPGNKCLGFRVIGSSIGVGAVSDQLAPTNLALTRPYDNLGIPGATSFDLVALRNPDPNGNTANRFAIPILRNVPGSPLAGTNAVEQAALLQPDLITLWIGNNDVLGALLVAVALDGVTLTPVPAFQAAYSGIFQTIQAPGRTIVTLNIVDVAAVPFATTIPPVVLNPATGQPVLTPGGQTIPLLGPGNAAYPCPPGFPACPVPAGTLVTLQAQTLLQQGYGILCDVAPLPHCNEPLPDGQFIPPSTLVPGVLLYPDEVALIRTRTSELNAQIASIGGAAGAVPFDINALFNQIKAEGYHIGGITLTPTFGTGGIFSADGFHPNNVGHAIIARETILVLNAARDLDIPEPNVAEALFTPDLPPGASAAATPPDAEELSAWTTRQLYALFPPIDPGVQILEPRTIRRPEPREHDRTRAVDRPPGDRNQ